MRVCIYDEENNKVSAGARYKINVGFAWCLSFFSLVVENQYFFSPHVSILNKTVWCKKKLYKNNADGIEKSVEIEL